MSEEALSLFLVCALQYNDSNTVGYILSKNINNSVLTKVNKSDLNAINVALSGGMTEEILFYIRNFLEEHENTLQKVNMDVATFNALSFHMHGGE